MNGPSAITLVTTLSFGYRINCKVSAASYRCRSSPGTNSNVLLPCTRRKVYLVDSERAQPELSCFDELEAVTATDNDDKNSTISFSNLTIPANDITDGARVYLQFSFKSWSTHPPTRGPCSTESARYRQTPQPKFLK